MGKRFAIVIGLAAVGVMALGAQAATSSTADRVKPDLQLSGPKKQSLRKSFHGRACFEVGRCQPNVRVKATCGEECTARAKGKLTKVQKDELKPLRGVRKPSSFLALKLTKKTYKQVREVLDEGEEVKAKVTVKAKDAAGNVATAERTIKLVK